MYWRVSNFMGTISRPKCIIDSLSLQAYAIQHTEPRGDHKEREKLENIVDKSPKQLGVADVQRHQTVVDQIQLR